MPDENSPLGGRPTPRRSAPSREKEILTHLLFSHPCTTRGGLFFPSLHNEEVAFFPLLAQREVAFFSPPCTRRGGAAGAGVVGQPLIACHASSHHSGFRPTPSHETRGKPFDAFRSRRRLGTRRYRTACPTNNVARSRKTQQPAISESVRPPPSRRASSAD